jgi:hypothetical protein
MLECEPLFHHFSLIDTCNRRVVSLVNKHCLLINAYYHFTNHSFVPLGSHFNIPNILAQSLHELCSTLSRVIIISSSAPH